MKLAYIIQCIALAAMVAQADEAADVVIYGSSPAALTAARRAGVRPLSRRCAAAESLFGFSVPQPAVSSSAKTVSSGKMRRSKRPHPLSHTVGASGPPDRANIFLQNNCIIK